MDFKAIEQMIHIMDDSSLGYLEVKWDEISIVMKKKGESGVVKSNTIEEPKLKNNLVENTNEELNSAEDRCKVEDSEETEEDGNIQEIKAPIVGTFYNKSAPDKSEYVNIGDKVKKGDILCIIEAMKIMNEIQSDEDGEIVDILVKNEEMVEYGQCLFKIKLDS
ncbi:acetyl-CoA carboxylase biotin carboxyl carrier protein [Clostridium sp. LBM24168]